MWLTIPAPFQAQEAACISPTGQNPKFIWTPQQQCTWNRMRKENHPWYQAIITNAEKDGGAVHADARYSSLGRWAMVAYQITGDPRFAVKAFKQLKGDSAFDAVLEGNGLREWAIEYHLMYDWLKPGLPAADRLEFETYLTRTVESAIKGVRFGDSDQMVGTYFLFALHDLNFGTNYLSRPIANTDRGVVRTVGGLTATGADLTSMRNAIALYARMGEGGIFIEGTDYNWGTLELLYMGVDAVRTATGVDHFPEVTAFRAQHAKFLRHELLPGMLNAFRFGDIENTGILLHHVDHLMMNVANQVPDQGLRSLHADLTKASGRSTNPEGGSGWPLYPRFFYANSPYVAARDWRADAPLLHVAKGMGHVFARTGWAPTDRALHFWSQNMEHPVHVDHWNTINGDLQFFRGGKLVIDHPLAYSNPPSNHNVLLVGGGASYERGGILGDPIYEAGKRLRVSGYNAGPSPLADGCAFETRRTVEWLMDSADDVIVVIDHVVSNCPAKQVWHTAEGKRTLENGPTRFVTAFVMGEGAARIGTVIEGESVKVTRPGLPDAFVSVTQSEIISDRRTPVPATASASSTMSGFEASRVVDGDRRSTYWNDSTENAFPDWVELTFAVPTTIQEVAVFSVQDYGAPKDPTPWMAFTTQGVIDFDVQVLEDSDWKTIASVRDNTSVQRNVAFAPVTTSKVRVQVLRTPDQWSRIAEFEAFADAGPVTPAPAPTRAPSSTSGPAPAPAPAPPSGPPSAPSPVETRKNLALASNGAKVTASSVLSGYESEFAINGDRQGARYWNDATPNAMPDWLQIDFAGSQKVSQVNVFSVQDAYGAPSIPTPATPFRLYGLKDFQLEYRSGAKWVLVPNGAIVNNGLVWRTVTFDPVTTSAIRILITGTPDQWSRIVEVEAYEVPAPGSVVTPGPTPPTGLRVVVGK